MTYDKTEMNAYVAALYDEKMREGKHGHYESLFHVVHKAIERAQPSDEALLRQAMELLAPFSMKSTEYMQLLTSIRARLEGGV